MRWGLVVSGLLAGVSIAAAASAATERALLEVTVGPEVSAPKGGRLLVFAEPVAAAEAAAKGGPIRGVGFKDVAGPGQVVAATEVDRAASGGRLVIDLDQAAYPEPFSRMPPGEYAVQAVLDVDHNYAYSGRTAGDLLSPVVRLRLPLEASAPALVLERAVPPVDRWTRPGLSAQGVQKLAALRPNTRQLAFESPALTAFWGRPVTMGGWVVTPPGYVESGKATYPTVYFFHGFGGDPDITLLNRAANAYEAMAAGRTPPMIWVFLDGSGRWGVHNFADSVNTGPWGKALTQELIPWLEREYRMDARANGRLLTGHSSGGWASLWLQTRYAKLFGGTWSTSPDPTDFHDFIGVDLYPDKTNLYVNAGGAKRPFMQNGGKVAATLEEFSRLEAMLGQSGQMAAFDWVFSPRGPDGRPLPMFDRVTGAVDPAVVTYWRDHYDLAHRIKADWRTLKPDLDGKIHVAVGAADNFYLDGAARRLQAVLGELGAKSRFDYIPGRDHFNLYEIGDNRWGLLEGYAWEMYKVARPGSRGPGTAARP